MLENWHLHWLAGVAFAAAIFAGGVSMAQPGAIEPVKLGFDAMSKADQDNLWKMVDEYATVDALQEFCGTKLYLQRRA